MQDTDFWKTNLDIHVQEGKRAITTKKQPEWYMEERLC